MWCIDNPTMDVGLVHLLQCPTLKALNLYDCLQISDNELRTLAKHPNLSTLVLAETTTDALSGKVNSPRFTQSGLAEFQKAAPQCSVKFELY